MPEHTINKCAMVLGLSFKDGQLTGRYASDQGTFIHEPHALLLPHSTIFIGKRPLLSSETWMELEEIKPAPRTIEAFGHLRGPDASGAYHATHFNALLTKSNWLLIPVENALQYARLLTPA